ncbi:MAG: fumarylacetoacetate hydrolase family protein [Actinobacteria bacterium]|nr:fumarylacetoacetate hydrolase family protein [Actinomycetota bacterium]
MDPSDLQAAADALARAQAERAPIAPLTETFADLDVTAAYEIQLEGISRRLAGGDTVEGHKVGLSAKAMQRMLGVHEPDYGHLLASMFLHESDAVAVERFCQPRVEIEVAFVLGRPLVGPGVTVADVIRATEFVLPSLEIVDSRIADWRIALPDTIADNASSGAVVLGGSPTRLTDVDVRLIGATLRSNGELRETGASGAVLGNPAVAVAWLANKVAAFGVALEAGHVIMPGSCTRMIPVAPGDAVTAEFDRLGAVSACFT